MLVKQGHSRTKKSGYQARRKGNKTYEWKDGIFNSRNIADRDYLWTNLRRRVADTIHDSAKKKPVAYLLAFSNSSDMTLRVWALPEPILHESLAGLPVKQGGREYTIQVSAKNQRIDHYAASPDLAPYFREFPLSRQEALVLKESRDVDALIKQERKSARGEKTPNTDDGEGNSAQESETSRILGSATQQLVDAGAFDPSGISDGRERVLSSIVRRRGQPAFRKQLLVAYNGRCAISGCDVEPVLEAAHIVSYKGPETNHPGNGLLLRADLHTLFDLKFIAVDVATMSLLVAPALAGTIYEGFSGSRITVPNDPHNQPSRDALEQHRRESGL